MSFNSFPSSTIFLSMFIISIYCIPTSFCQVDVQYEACPVRFPCANFPNLEYPFWGGGRPSQCGHPGFKLNCEGDFPVIILQSRSYRVLGIDTRSQVITVARTDLWNNTCPSVIYDTHFDYELFRHPSGYQEIVLSYGCTNVSSQLSPYGFECMVNRTSTSSHSYFLTRSAYSALDTTLNCSDTIYVPIIQTSAQLLNAATSSEDDLREVLKGGFRLIWEANNTNCNECARSSGRCGYNSATSSFACFCSDRPYQFRCGKTDSGLGKFSFALHFFSSKYKWYKKNLSNNS